MSEYKLVRLVDSEHEIARVLLGTGLARVETSEDKCFGSDFWSLGDISIAGETSDLRSTHAAVARGAYKWRLPPLAAARSELMKLLHVEEQTGARTTSGKDQTKQQKDHDKIISRIARIMDTVATTAVRLGMTHPIFDPGSLEVMPFRRSCTVVADTSGVLQGGLDFVARFLGPSTRIKVPAIVHMELVNQADAFLKWRRASKTNASMLLLDHLISQAGLRVLLRLEFREDTEIERTLLVGDPLRNAFRDDKEPECSDLNLSVPLRSYCDRLIIEAARQHQAYSSPGHQIQLLTCDQGFARMALAEGIAPLFFKAVSANDFFGSQFAGCIFHPFSAYLYRIPLQSLLWELATAFGAARLRSLDGNRWVEIAAFGEHLSWSPMHSREDLLWMRSGGLPIISNIVPTEPLTKPAGMPPTRPTKERKAASAATPSAAKESAISLDASFYRLNVERLLRLVTELGREGKLAESAARRIVESTTEETFTQYKRLLLSGEFVRTENDIWSITDAGSALALAIHECDPNGLTLSLSRVPTIASFLKELNEWKVGAPFASQIPERVQPTYKTIGEIACIGASIAEEGYFATPRRPKIAEFVDIALECFGALDTGDGFVSAGTWLEELVRKYGIHPEIARRSLDEASASELIVRSTEGSTINTRHDKHAIRVLRKSSSGPRVETVHLYRGDFLVPNKSSSSIRLRRPKS